MLGKELGSRFLVFMSYLVPQELRLPPRQMPPAGLFSSFVWEPVKGGLNAGCRKLSAAGVHGND